MQMIPDQSKDLHRVYYQKNNLTYGPIIGGRSLIKDVDNHS